MKEQLKKKLKSYSALAGVLISSEASSQIIYTDVAPDYKCYGEGECFYNLDLNNDGNFDFRIQDYFTRTATGNYSRSMFTISTLYVNAVALDDNKIKGADDFLGADNFSNKIGHSQDWISDGLLFFYRDTRHNTDRKGLWYSQTGEYLGLELRIKNYSYFGWVRIDITSRGFTVKDYAYNLRPDEPILAGQQSKCLPPIPVISMTDSTWNQVKLSACPDAGYSYQWKLNGNNIPNATQANFTATKYGNYTVEITDKGGCSSISENFSFISTYEGSMLHRETFQYFLSQRTLSVELISREYLNGELSVFDVTGKKSAKKKITGSSEQLDLSHLPAGVYVLEIRNNGLTEKRKFVLN